MTLIDTNGTIHSDSDDLTDAMRESVKKSCPRLAVEGNCLYQFNPDGFLDVYDISTKPFVHLRLSTVEREKFKSEEEVYTKDFHVQVICANLVRAYGDNGVVGVFPRELLMRW